MVKINGREIDAAGKTVSRYLEEAEYNPARIVVELNEEILPKSEYSDKVIAEGDVIEIVTFMGGGR